MSTQQSLNYTNTTPYTIDIIGAAESDKTSQTMPALDW